MDLYVSFMMILLFVKMCAWLSRKCWNRVCNLPSKASRQGNCFWYPLRVFVWFCSHVSRAGGPERLDCLRFVRRVLRAFQQKAGLTNKNQEVDSCQSGSSFNFVFSYLVLIPSMFELNRLGGMENIHSVFDVLKKGLPLAWGSISILDTQDATFSSCGNC